MPAGWKPLKRLRVVQQVELVEKPYQVSEHRARLYENLRTGQVLAAPLPARGTAGRAAWPATDGPGGLPERRLPHVGGDDSQVPDGRFAFADQPRAGGQDGAESQRGAWRPATSSCRRPCREQAYMGIDETGTSRAWPRPVELVLPRAWPGSLHVVPHRPVAGIEGIETIPWARRFTGIIGCDYYSAYRKFLRETNVWLQLCWAHLIRDVKYLTTLSDRATRGYGQRLLGEDQVAVPHVASPRADARRAVEACRDQKLAAKCCPWRGKRRRRVKPKTLPSGSAIMATPISPSWTRRASSRQTTAPSGKFASLPSTAKSLKGRGGRPVVAGASASGRRWPPVPNKAVRPSSSFAIRSSPTSPTNPSPPSSPLPP